MKMQVYQLTTLVLLISIMTVFGHLPLSGGQQQNATETGSPASVTIIIPSGASIANQVQEYYQPEVAQVANGSFVTWSNRDSALHTATAGNPVAGPSGQFDTGMISPGGFGSAMISGEGRIAYYCTLHPFMLGAIQVTTATALAGSNVTDARDANVTGAEPPRDNATVSNATDGTMPEPFTAQGSIASLILPVSQDANTTVASEAGGNESYVVSGNWNLDVQSGNATQFEASFDMVHSDGTGRHTHEISNFESVSSLQQNGSIVITGTSDISLNGTMQWTQVWVTVIIENNSTLNIGVNTEATKNHFHGQPIFGIIDSMQDERGNEISSTDGAEPVETLQEELSDLGANASQAGREVINETRQAGEEFLDQ